MEGLRILIVEDDPIIAADLEDRFSQLGYAVLGPVASGAEALAIFIAQAPDLVVMDVQLEGDMDGIETNRQIQRIRPLPVIFLTSNSDESTFARARATLPAAFMSKPFRSRDLQYNIDLALSRNALAQQAPQADSTPAGAYIFQDRLFVRTKDRLARLFIRDILWIEADDYYCKIVAADRQFLVTQTLKKFSDTVAGIPELMRVHRSYIVNLTQIEEIGDLFVYLGGHKIPVSKSLRDELLARLKSI
ncbi:MAG: response regulator [Saprospiraceae bacterium]|nr:response regulator [Saprospiraceae bacterium]